MVLEHQDEHDSQWAAICSIANKFGVSHETRRKWVRKAEVDDGLRAGLTSDERDRLKALERENRELRRANEILKKAAAFLRVNVEVAWLGCAATAVSWADRRGLRGAWQRPN
jgi:transposase